jgi:hypothetical protein
VIQSIGAEPACFRGIHLIREWDDIPFCHSTVFVNFEVPSLSIIVYTGYERALFCPANLMCIQCQIFGYHSHTLNNLNWSVAFAVSPGTVRHCVPIQPTVLTALKCMRTVAVDILFFPMIRLSRTWGGWRGSQELRVDEKAVRYLGWMWRLWDHRVYLSTLCTFMHTSHRRTW